jgi:hypothetical protein
MKDALAMYQSVLYEIDQFQSAVFDYEDFNYWMPKAVNIWYSRQLEEYEKTQVVADRISCMVKQTNSIVLNAPTTTTSDKQFDVPEDYRHLLNCLSTLRYRQATPSYPAGSKRSAYTKRYTGDNQASFMDNYYTKPLVSDADVRVYHRVIGNKVFILYDTPVHENPSVVIESVVMEYFMQPPPVQLSQALIIVQDTLFPEHSNREIIKICAALFLENEQSQRLQTHAAINN